MKILTSTAENGVVLIEVEGEIDAQTARELDRTLNDLLAQGHNRLVLDATQMAFISSAGLRAIVFAQQEACRRRGQLRVCGLTAEGRQIFEMAALDECLYLGHTRQQAMADW
jgi:anti-anti-sigma factor